MDRENYSSSKYEEEIDDVLSGIEERSGFGWSMIRALGELQVLTRASYLMLILVPLLAGLWPGVKVVVNQYNDSVETATQRLQVASERLDLFVNEKTEYIKSAPVINEITMSLSEDISNIQTSINNVSIESDEMPDVWVWVFLSALAAILAHTTYQIGAPPIIQQASAREYINSRIDEEIKIRGEEANLRDVVLKARKEYLYSSRTRIPVSLISMALYGASITMIIIVIQSQTRNVLSAAQGGYKT